jgi:site-specific DNA-methyltransferase (adenine-specific)
LCIVVGDVCLSRRKIGRHLVVPLHADISVQCRNIGFDYLTPILWYKIANAATEVVGNGSPFLGKPYEPNAIIKNDVEYILMFRKAGGYRKPTLEQRLLSLIEKDNHARWFRAIWDDIPGSSRTRGHPAPYPVELAFRLIKMFSFVGDIVLDPFLGTGTTTEAAILARRWSIGYEIEKIYYKLVKDRFAQSQVGAVVTFE